MSTVARITDIEIVHCSQPARSKGSPSVFVNGLCWSRISDLNIVHLMPGNPCPAHVFALAKGSGTVFINGLSAGRLSDPTCTAVASGSPNVVCGG